MLRRSLFFVALLSLLGIAPLTVQAQNTLVPAGQTRYEASTFPDRIILIPTETPATTQTVNWRTDTSVTQTLAEIRPAIDSPALHVDADRYTGTHTELIADNGPAHHHSVTFTDLLPDTLYVYRVAGGAWSEWFQFRTPQEAFAPYTAIYFGDAQNSVKAHFSRVIRAAHGTAPEAQIMIHAGDMVESSGGDHDNKWGEWFDAGGWINSMRNQLLAAGNHEYTWQISPELGAGSRLIPHWEPQFSTPNNGPEPLQRTVYYVDYQGVRYIVLDSTAALQTQRLAILQAQWLIRVLNNNPNQWTVVVYHHPMYSVSQGRDNPALRRHWLPILEQYNVDLVLQGHDHTYGRTQSRSVHAHENGVGPVFLVSIAGPKMYPLSEHAKEFMIQPAENTQLFQTIKFTETYIRYDAHTVTGVLHDAFDLVRGERGEKHVVERLP